MAVPHDSAAGCHQVSDDERLNSAIFIYFNVRAAVVGYEQMMRVENQK